MKRFQIVVRTKVGFITVSGSSVKLTGVCSEIIAKDQYDLTQQLSHFLTQVQSFHGLETGVSREEAESLVETRKGFEEALKKFHLNPSLWTHVQFSSSTSYWEILLDFQGEW